MATFNIIMPHAIVTNYKPKDSLCSFVRKKSSIVACSGVRCNAKNPGEVIKPRDEVSVGRRSGNYEPPIWELNYAQSTSSQYTEEKYLRRAKELVARVKKLLDEELKEPVQQLELIDDLHKMGISYHFKDQINQILNSRHNTKDSQIERDLYSTALEFRLFRQYGFSISQDVFDCFQSDKGDFKASLADDTRGLLQLYEATFMSMEDEEILERAKKFATYSLQKKRRDGTLNDENLSSLIRHALELPVHWRTQRLNARWFIEAYRKREDKYPIVIELAELDFNILQATYQDELKQISRWWEQTCLAEKLPFARDRLVESMYWAIGWIYEPQYAYARSVSAKLIALITVIDDIYDVYGTLEELNLFRDVIQRWDIEALDKLPHYMQVCFLALNNFIDEIGYYVLREQGFLVIPYLRKLWADLCNSYFQEAKWYYSGYTPTLEEYIENARVSISGPLVTFQTYFLVANPIEKEVVETMYKDPDLIRYSSIIFRLSDDVGTSQGELKRGDVPKAVECYMNESGATRDEARRHIELLICDAWKKLNQERHVNLSFPEFFGRNAADLCRTSQFIYQNGDGFGIQNPYIKEHISSLLFDPIV